MLDFEDKFALDDIVDFINKRFNMVEIDPIGPGHHIHTVITQHLVKQRRLKTPKNPVGRPPKPIKTEVSRW